MTMVRRFRPKGGDPRPVCTVCHKPYGRRFANWTTTRLAPGTEVLDYRGNEMLLCESIEYGVKRRKEGAPQGLPHWTPGYWDEQHWEAVTEVRRETWNGRWSGGYEPFCTLNCALDFARAAHRDGVRYARKKEG